MAFFVRALSCFRTTSPGASADSAAGVTIDGSGGWTAQQDNRTVSAAKVGNYLTSTPSTSPEWVMCPNMYIEDHASYGTGHVMRVWDLRTTVNQLTVKRIKKASGKYTVAIYEGVNLRAESATEFSFGAANKYHVAIKGQNVVGNLLEVWWGADPQTDAATVEYAVATIFQKAMVNLDGGQTVLVGGGPIAWFYTTDGEIPALASVATGEFTLNTNTPQHNDYTHTQAGAGATITQKRNAVDDLETGVENDDTDFCENPATASSTFRQTFESDPPTMSNTIWVHNIFRGKVTAGNKTFSIYSISADGTVKEERLLASAWPNTSYAFYHAVHEIAPDGAAWEQADLDLYEPGVRWDVGPDAETFRCSALFAEAVSFTFIRRRRPKSLQVNQAVNRAAVW